MTTTVQTVSLSLVKLRGPFYSPQLAVRSRLGRRSQQPGAWRAAHGAEARVAATLQAGRGIEPEAGASQRELRWTPHALLCSWFCRGCPPRVLCRRAAADPAKAHGPGCRRARYPFRGSHRRRLRPVGLDQGTVRRLPASNTGAVPCPGTAMSAAHLTETALARRSAASCAIATHPSGSFSLTSSAPTRTRRTCGTPCRWPACCSPARCGR